MYTKPKREPAVLRAPKRMRVVGIQVLLLPLRFVEDGHHAVELHLPLWRLGLASDESLVINFALPPTLSDLIRVYSIANAQQPATTLLHASG